MFSETRIVNRNDQPQSRAAAKAARLARGARAGDFTAGSCRV